jgi:hypothetical protein
MKRNPWLISGSVLVATWMTTGAGWAQSSGTKQGEVHPDVSGPSGSKGGSQSERTGETGVPLPKGSPQSGTVDTGKSGGSSSGTAQSPKGQTINPSANASKGGSQSERTGESGVPLPKGSPQAGTVDMGRSEGSSGMGSSGTMGNRGSMTNVKEVQQALKDKGYDPGPVDGVMGAKTKEALKSFQSASNLPATGSLNAQTADKLGVQSNGAARSGSSSSPSSSGSMRSRDNMKSSDTTQGKDTDQPNQTPAK